MLLQSPVQVHERCFFHQHFWQFHGKYFILGSQKKVLS